MLVLQVLDNLRSLELLCGMRNSLLDSGLTRTSTDALRNVFLYAFRCLDGFLLGWWLKLQINGQRRLTVSFQNWDPSSRCLFLYPRLKNHKLIYDSWSSCFAVIEDKESTWTGKWCRTLKTTAECRNLSNELSVNCCYLLGGTIERMYTSYPIWLLLSN